MNKIFKKNDEGIGAVGALLGLTFYLFLVSFILSFLILNIYGTELIGIPLPTTKNIQEFSNEQNYQTGDYNLSLNINPWWGTWEYTKGIGVYLTSINLIRPYSYITLRYIQDVNGVYTNTYYINNSIHGDYCVGMRVTFGSDTNEVCVNSEGIYIPDYVYLTNVVWGNHVFVSYPDANLIEDVVIKTVYNEKTLEADIYFNGDKIITTNQLETPLDIVAGNGVYYGGVSSNTIGFTLEDFKTENPITKITGESNILSLLADLLKTVIAISMYSIPTWILPTEFVTLFLTLPEAGLIICIVIVFAKGVD